MSSDESKLATAKTILSTVGSIAATAMVVRSVASDYLPSEFQEHVSHGIRSFFNRFSNQLTMVIDEFDGIVNNEIYEAAEVYLGSKMTPNTRRIKVSKPEKEKGFNITMDKNEEVVDIYNGVKFKWLWACTRVESRHFYNPRDMNSTLKSEVRSFELTFHKKHKDMVIDSYLPDLINQAMIKKQEKKSLKIFTVDYENIYDMTDLWIPVNLDHPLTFEKLAMDTEVKDMILSDLERFVKRKDYYKKIGKAWKRGYLLYGPPGTGKSSLIAAMANYLHFDIYDLDLTELKKNSDLRKVLVATANKSIMVVEDIDCTIDLQKKLTNRDSSKPRDKDLEEGEESKVTLSGLLNFIDGLWSSCGDERIIIFTTNHIEKLDPALLRPGRMDVHIHMSYCTPCGFKLLANNYLGIKEHELFQEIEELILTSKVTPAEVAEQLLKCDEPDNNLKGLVKFLYTKKKEDNEEIKSKISEEIEERGSEQEGKINKDNVGNEADV